MIYVVVGNEMSLMKEERVDRLFYRDTSKQVIGVVWPWKNR